MGGTNKRPEGAPTTTSQPPSATAQPPSVTARVVLVLGLGLGLGLGSRLSLAAVGPPQGLHSYSTYGQALAVSRQSRKGCESYG